MFVFKVVNAFKVSVKKTKNQHTFSHPLSSDFKNKQWNSQTLGKESIHTGLEWSTVKKSGLVRNLALGDCSSRARRDLELD